MKVRFTLEQATKAQRGSRRIAVYSFLTSVLDWGGWSTPRPVRFPPGNNPVPIAQEAGWTPGPGWTGAENLASTVIRSPDHPARYQSLYRLSYPAYVRPYILYFYILLFIQHNGDVSLERLRKALQSTTKRRMDKENLTFILYSRIYSGPDSNPH